MLNIFEEKGIWYCEFEGDDFHLYQVNTAEPENFTCLWKSDRHIVYTAHVDDLFGARRIYYYRLHELLTQYREHMNQ